MRLLDNSELAHVAGGVTTLPTIFTSGPNANGFLDDFWGMGDDLHNPYGHSSTSYGKDDTAGSSARHAAVKNCQGLPDDAKVTFTVKISADVKGSVGGVGGGSSTEQSFTIETTCGALRGKKG